MPSRNKVAPDNGLDAHSKMPAIVAQRMSCNGTNAARITVATTLVKLFRVGVIVPPRRSNIFPSHRTLWDGVKELFGDTTRALQVRNTPKLCPTSDSQCGSFARIKTSSR